MDILRSGIAFFLLKGLKKVPAPRHSDYVDFGPNKKSKFEVLVKLVQSCCVRFSYIPNMKRKLLKSLREEQDKLCQVQSEEVANAFLSQWPRRKLHIKQCPCENSQQGKCTGFHFAYMETMPPKCGIC